MNILGINAYHGNASAAVVCDGKLIAAVEEERFNRVKYAAGFPVQAIRYCLKTAGLTLNEIDHVAVPRNPYARLATKIFYALRMPSFARERAKVLVKFQGIPEALAQAFNTDPKKIRAKFHGKISKGEINGNIDVPAYKGIRTSRCGRCCSGSRSRDSKTCRTGL